VNSQLSIYENAKHWIAQYESVDEVKGYIDKAAAVEEYARRANDYEMEHQAARARVRAERRCGELLQAMEKAKGAAGNPGGQGAKIVRSNGATTQTLSDMGLTKNQSSKFQQLANVPEEEFEKALNVEGGKPSTHSILSSRSPKAEQQRIDPDSIRLWGDLLEFEKQFFKKDREALIEGMTPAMQPDARRVIPKVVAWLGGSL